MFSRLSEREVDLAQSDDGVLVRTFDDLVVNLAVSRPGSRVFSGLLLVGGVGRPLAEWCRECLGRRVTRWRRGQADEVVHCWEQEDADVGLWVRNGQVGAAVVMHTGLMELALERNGYGRLPAAPPTWFR